MLNQLKVAPKLMLLTALVAVPLLGATLYFMISGSNQQLRQAAREKTGLACQRPLAALLDAVPQHQWLADAVVRGDAAAKATLLEKAAELDQTFAELEALVAASGNLGLGAGEKTSGSLKEQWQKLKQTALTLSPADNATAHQALVTAIRALMTRAGDTTQLTLDPDLTSAYLVDVTLRALPQTQDRLAAVTTYAQNLLRRDKATLNPKDLAQLDTYAALLQTADVDRVNASLETALTAAPGQNASLQRNLTQPRQDYQAANQEYLDLLHRTATDPASAPADALLAAGQKARAASHALWQTTATELDTLVTRRASALQQKRLFGLGLVVAALLVSIGVAWTVTRSLTRPLASLTQATQRILRGDATVRAAVHGQDEIGELAESFNAMLGARNKASGTVEAENKRLQANIQELLVVVSEASDGKLGVRAKVSEGALGNVCDALNLMLENVGGIINNAKSASSQVAAASSGISQVAVELEKGEVRQTQEILSTSQGVKDLNGKAQQVLENCHAATRAAENGRKAAEQGAKAVREVIKGMEKIRENTQANAKKIKRLGDRSLEISGIVKVIGDISAKTDMLALNASIEAARAGEQGRGFTVVAEQVRSLADRTKTLTNQIEKLVNDIQKETAEAVGQMETQTQEVEAGSRAAQTAGGTLENIVKVSEESSELVGQINESASSQAARTAEMLETVESINQVVAAASVKVRETRSTSEQLLALSAELNKRLSQFETEGNSVVYEQSPA